MTDSVDHVNQMGAALPDDVLELAHTLMHRVRACRHQAMRDGPHDLTHLETKVLAYFARHPGHTQRDLALHAGRDKAQLARLVGGLRERGLLDAQADPQDRRVTRLQPSAAGRVLLKAWQAQDRRLSRQAVRGLSADDQARLIAGLQQVIANLADDGG